jgi:hypothetical protein
MMTAINDSACPSELKPVLMLLARFFDAVAERPLSLQEYLANEGARQREAVGGYVAKAEERSAEQSASQAMTDFRQVEPLALDFLRWSRDRDGDQTTTVSELATVTR